MTQEREEVKRIEELNSLFMILDDRGQDDALIILRSLGFAQSVMLLPEHVKKTEKPSNNCLA